MGDTEDPYLMAGFPLSEWERTETGQWVIANTLEPPVFYCIPNQYLGYNIVVEALFTKESAVEYALKFDINKPQVS
jgi:hypothetical protein